MYHCPLFSGCFPNSKWNFLAKYIFLGVLSEGGFGVRFNRMFLFMARKAISEGPSFYWLWGFAWFRQSPAIFWAIFISLRVMWPRKRRLGEIVHTWNYPLVGFTVLRLSPGAYSSFYGMNAVLYHIHKLHSVFIK